MSLPMGTAHLFMGCSIASHALMVFSLREKATPNRYALRMTGMVLASTSLISALFLSRIFRNTPDLKGYLILYQPNQVVTVAVAAVSLCNQVFLYFLNHFPQNESPSSKEQLMPPS